MGTSALHTRSTGAFGLTPESASSVSFDGELRVIGLGNLRAERIHFQGGVGSTTLDFSGAWERSATASVQMGVGELVLRFPRSVGVRINRSSFLTSFDADRFEQRDGAYFSDNWQRAAHQLIVDVDAAFGSVVIEWIDD